MNLRIVGPASSSNCLDDYQTWEKHSLPSYCNVEACHRSMIGPEDCNPVDPYPGFVDSLERRISPSQ